MSVEPAPSATLYTAGSSLPTSVDGQELKAEQEKLRVRGELSLSAQLIGVLQLQSFLTPELQQALTALVSSSKSDDKATISELQRRLEVHTTRNARLAAELAVSQAQLAAQKKLNEELETKLSETKKALAKAESRMDELDTAEVSGLLVCLAIRGVVHADQCRAQMTSRHLFHVSLSPLCATNVCQACDRVGHLLQATSD